MGFVCELREFFYYYIVLLVVENGVFVGEYEEVVVGEEVYEWVEVVILGIVGLYVKVR